MATIHDFGGREPLQYAVARRLRGLLGEISMAKTEFAEKLHWDRGYLYRRPKSAPRPISDAAMAKLLSESSDPQLTAMLILGGYQGLRVSEIARMRGDLIDPDSRTIRVRGKGGHVIVLPVHPRVLAIARRMPRGYWFPSQRGQHLGGRTISQRLRLHMIRCRVGGTAHSLRHRFCTSMVEQGVDIRVVQELARHSQLSTTALYVAATDARQRAALEMLA